MLISGSQITVHGREAMYIPYKRSIVVDANTTTQVDISASRIFFEVPAVIRKQLIANPADSKSLVIELTLEEVDLLPTTATSWATIDETGDLPSVELQGTIVRNGWVAVPPSV